MKIAILLILSLGGATERTQGARADQVIETFPAGFSRRAEKLRAAARGGAVAEPEIIRLAKEYLAQGRMNGDAASINLASTLLEPVVSKGTAPGEALLTMAGARSFQHDFIGAIEALDRASLEKDCRLEALLRKISIQVTLGRFDDARTIFAANPLLLGENQGVTLMTLLASQTGQLEASWNLLSRHIDGNLRLTREELGWSLGALAEMAERLGRIEEAEKRYRQALAAAGPDIYLANAWLDFLIDRGRLQEALAAYLAFPNRETLLLRKAIIEPEPGEIALLEKQLMRSSTHAREKSLFHLKVKKNASDALEAALQNWTTQKEAIDVRLVLESAFISGKLDAAAPVIDWIRKNRFEDVRLGRFLKEAPL